MLRREITFEQAEGIDALPSQLERGHITPVIRARLWHALYQSLQSSSTFQSGYRRVSTRWQAALLNMYVRKFGVFSDTITDRLDRHAERLKPIFENGKTHIVLGVTEWLLRSYNAGGFTSAVATILVEERSAYRLVDDHDIVPLASDEEGQALLGALTALDDANLQGARTHLKAAAHAAALGSFADSVRESMQAIESAARSLTGSSKFSDALSTIEQERRLHTAFKRGLTSLYGYSSDEEGIRHPLLENGDAAVSEADAILMLGICASAVTYLLSHR